MFVQVTKSRRKAGKTYLSYLVREAFRTAAGPRSRTVCNITDLPAETRDLIVASLKGQSFVNYIKHWTTEGWLSSMTVGDALDWIVFWRRWVPPASEDYSRR